jgi:hypothetical protein
MTMSAFSWIGLSESSGEKQAESAARSAKDSLKPDWTIEAGYEEAARQALARAQAASSAMAAAPSVAPVTADYGLHSTWAQGAADSPLAAARQQQAALAAGTDVTTKGVSQMEQERTARQEALIRAQLAAAQQQQMEQLIKQKNEAAIRAHYVAEAERRFAAEQASRIHRAQIIGGLAAGGGAVLQTEAAKEIASNA